MCLANHSSIGSGRRWNSSYPSQRRVVPWIHWSFLSARDVVEHCLHVATRDIAAAASRLLLDDSWSSSGEVPLLGPARRRRSGESDVRAS
jgi:hypothetical protein